ncbi:unnamed protein product, partial [Rotaria sp. Silwood1]
FRRAAENSPRLNQHGTRRFPINQNGVHGSFYDARIDRILDKLPLG